MDDLVCSVCSKAFSSPRSLASHMKAHQKSAACPLCGESVRYLGPHLKIAHKDDPLVQLESNFLGLVDEVRRLRVENRKLKEKDTGAEPID